MSQEPVDALKFAMSKIDQPHRHHRHCVHNLSRAEQLALRKRRSDGREWTDEEMRILKLDQHIVEITPNDWEIEVPDLDFTRLEGL